MFAVSSLNVEKSFTEQAPVPIAKFVLSVCFISGFNKFNDDMPIVSGEIPYHKARALLPLVGNVLSIDNTSRLMVVPSDHQGLVGIFLSFNVQSRKRKMGSWKANRQMVFKV